MADRGIAAGRWRSGNGGIPKKIQNIILAAPDLDIDVFRQQLADMGPDRPKFTIFVSRDDRALRVSRRISGNVDRLGADQHCEPGQYQALLERERYCRSRSLTALRGGDRPEPFQVCRQSGSRAAFWAIV
jgi:hypothetical protein